MFAFVNVHLPWGDDVVWTLIVSSMALYCISLAGKRRNG